MERLRSVTASHGSLRNAFDGRIYEPSRRRRDAYISASLGLLCVAMICVVGLPQSPARVALRERNEAISYELRDPPSEEIITIDASNRKADANEERMPHLQNGRLNGEAISLHASSKTKDGMLSKALGSLSGWVHSWFANRKKKAKRAEDNTQDTSRAANAGNTSSAATDREEKSYVEDNIDGMEIAYSKSVPKKSIDGVVFLFHGCGQSAKDWYELPEHLAIERQLRKKRLATLALSAKNGASGCWSTRFPAHKNEDAARVSRVVKAWLQSKSLPWNITSHGVGISSGGTFLSILSTLPVLSTIRSQVLYVSPGSMRAFHRATNEYPNTLFVHLGNDKHFASRKAVNNARHVLLSRGVPLVGELQLPIVGLREWTLNARDPRFTMRQSKAFHRAVNECNRAKSQGGDSKLCSYEDVRQMGSEKGEFQPASAGSLRSQRALAQILRVTTGQHEVQSQNADKIVSWLKANKKARRVRPKRAIKETKLA